ncbi:MAG: hypothetical protein K0V04_46570, partial [Deltaproteobacteria bacterium]|nr:hypothetical protein [Deltaproteobacteria bacterium]
MANQSKGLVLQGYFRVERARSPAAISAAAQPKAALRSSPRPPRPDLLPRKMRSMVTQRKTGTGRGAGWSGAPRPELLPGMGAARAVRPLTTIQAQAGARISTTPVPAGRLQAAGEGRPLEP